MSIPTVPRGKRKASSFSFERLVKSLAVVAAMMFPNTSNRCDYKADDGERDNAEPKYHLSILPPKIAVEAAQIKPGGFVAARKKKKAKKGIARKPARKVSRTSTPGGRRRKGHAFERWVAQQLSAVAPLDARVRRGLQYQGGDVAADVEFPGWWIECKTGRRAQLRTGFEQAVEIAPRNRRPLLIAKDDYKPAIAMMRFADFIYLLDENKTLRERLRAQEAKRRR